MVAKITHIVVAADTVADLGPAADRFKDILEGGEREWDLLAEEPGILDAPDGDYTLVLKKTAAESLEIKVTIVDESGRSEAFSMEMELTDPDQFTETLSYFIEMPENFADLVRVKAEALMVAVAIHGKPMPVAMPAPSAKTIAEKKLN